MQQIQAPRPVRVGEAAPLPPEAPVVDRRGEPRLRCNVGVRASPCEGRGAGDFHTAMLADCSSGGICLILPWAVRPGGQVLVALPGGGASIGLYTARHCEQQATGQFRVGAALVGFNTAGRALEHSLPLIKSLLLGRADE